MASCKKEDSLRDYDYGTLGAAASELLSAQKYPSLLVQINYMPGFAVNDTVINNFRDFLNAYLNKPEGIQITTREIFSAGKESLSLDEIVRLERTHRNFLTGGKVITVHVLITDGRFADNDVLAKSYWNTSISLFGKTIADYSGQPGQLSNMALTATMLRHEFGHLMGLVNQGSPMQVDHLDPDNGAHCTNITCLMNYAIKTSDANGRDFIPSFDKDCLDDLKANGGK